VYLGQVMISGIPAVPRSQVSEKGVWGIKFIAPEFMMTWFCHPSMLITLSPASNQLDSEFMANPMPSPMTTSPSTIEGAYDLRSLILPRT
jgi:hypothetical protein